MLGSWSLTVWKNKTPALTNLPHPDPSNTATTKISITWHAQGRQSKRWLHHYNKSNSQCHSRKQTVCVCLFTIKKKTKPSEAACDRRFVPCRRAHIPSQGRRHTVLTILRIHTNPAEDNDRPATDKFSHASVSYGDTLSYSPGINNATLHAGRHEQHPRHDWLQLLQNEQRYGGAVEKKGSFVWVWGVRQKDTKIWLTALVYLSQSLNS